MLFTIEQAQNIKREFTLIKGHRFDIEGKRLTVVNFVIEPAGEDLYIVLVCFEAVNNYMVVKPLPEFLEEAKIPFELSDYN